MNCDCYDQVSENLKAKGLAISDKCRSFCITDNTLGMALGFPLQATDGKRLKRSQPSMVFVSFCPFCGKSTKEEPSTLNQPKPNEH